MGGRQTQSRQDEGDRYYSKPHASATAAASGRRARIQPACPRSYRERQADGCRPRNHVAVVEFHSLMYAMRVLRAHSTPITSLHDIFRATILLGLVQYAALAWSTGRECVRLLIARVLNRCCVVPNDSGTAQTTCQPSPTYSTPLTMTFFIVSKATPTTFCSLTYLTKLTYHTAFAPTLRT